MKSLKFRSFSIIFESTSHTLFRYKLFVWLYVSSISNIMASLLISTLLIKIITFLEVVSIFCFVFRLMGLKFFSISSCFQELVVNFRCQIFKTSDKM